MCNENKDRSHWLQVVCHWLLVWFVGIGGLATPIAHDLWPMSLYRDPRTILTGEDTALSPTNPAPLTAAETARHRRRMTGVGLTTVTQTAKAAEFFEVRRRIGMIHEHQIGPIHQLGRGPTGVEFDGRRQHLASPVGHTETPQPGDRPALRQRQAGQRPGSPGVGGGDEQVPDLGWGQPLSTDGCQESETASRLDRRQRRRLRKLLSRHPELMAPVFKRDREDGNGKLIGHRRLYQPALTGARLRDGAGDRDGKLSGDRPDFVNVTGSERHRLILS